MSKKCSLITTENNQIVKIPGLFRTEFMFIGECADAALSEDGAFVRSCQVAETGNFLFKFNMENDDECDFLIFCISCWNSQVDALIDALDEFGRKMRWKYPRYEKFVDNIFGKIFAEKGKVV